jgi:branched-chain amino acid transport system substrate-binding protein
MEQRISRRRRAAGLAATAAAAAMLAAGCGNTAGSRSDTSASSDAPATSAGTSAKKDGGTISIGVLSTCEGPFAAFYGQTLDGVKVALSEYGGKPAGTKPGDPVDGAVVGGKQIKLVDECSDASADKALAAVRRLVEQDHVDMVVGPVSGDEGLAVRNYARSQPNVTFVNGTSGGQEATLDNPAPNFFRFNIEGAQEMAGLGEYAYRTLGWRKAATIGDDYSYPYTQIAGFVAEFCSLGGQIVKRTWPPLGTTDYSTYATQIPTTGIDGIFVSIGGSGTAQFFKAYNGFNGNLAKHMLAGSIVLDPNLVERKLLGDRVLGVVTGNGYAPDSQAQGWQKYIAGVKQYFPKDEPIASSDFMANYYTNTRALLQGIETVHGDLSGGQAKLRQALATETVPSPSGPVKLDDNRQAVGTAFLKEVVRGSSGSFGFKTIETVPDVEQGFGGAFAPGAPPPSRTEPKCVKRTPPGWVGHTVAGPPKAGA